VGGMIRYRVIDIEVLKKYVELFLEKAGVMNLSSSKLWGILIRENFKIFSPNLNKITIK
jgi:hypothetical protein